MHVYGCTCPVSQSGSASASTEDGPNGSPLLFIKKKRKSRRYGTALWLVREEVKRLSV